MKFIFASIYTIASLIAVSSQYTGPVFITSPLNGTVYTAGKPAVINWINPVSDIITKIVLAQGISTNIQPLITIAENVDSKLGTYSWNVPADIAPGDNYAFVLGVSPNVSYTGQFTIKNDNAAPIVSSAASSGAVTPAAAPTGAVSSGTVSSGPAPSKAAPSGASNSAHGSASGTPTAASHSSAASSNKVAFGVVAAAGVAVMALI